MKKLLLVATIILVSSCSVNTSGNIDVDTNDIKYFKDERTGLCFGIVASRKSFDTDATGLGVTCVPCEKVENHLTRVVR